MNSTTDKQAFYMQSEQCRYVQLNDNSMSQESYELHCWCNFAMSRIEMMQSRYKIFLSLSLCIFMSQPYYMQYRKSYLTVIYYKGMFH